MRYMFLIYSREMDPGTLSEAEIERIKAAHWAVMGEAQRRGVFEAANPLTSTASATTVRMDNGKPLVIDGPFAETKEQLLGYYILQCKDLDDGIGWAAKILTHCQGGHGCVEIRPLDELPER
jgi:hypothetical protein